MRFMVIVKANDKSEAGIMPPERLISEMMKFNEELVNAGVMLAGEGLQASSKGARVRFSAGTTSVIDGPFAETKELIAGYWLWQCDSLQEAIEWARKIPNPLNEEHEVEIRTVFDASTCSDVISQELQEQEARLRAQAAANQK
jgi:hypothetical protein